MEYSQQFLAKLAYNIDIATKEYPPSLFVESSKGIITASENNTRLFQSMISINILRNAGCMLPIELFYADDTELTKSDIAMLETLHVKCVNIQSFQLFKNYDAKNFSIKALAVYLSSFDETIWMDADIIPLINFDRLFDLTLYRRHHHLFFEDIFSYDKNENAMTKTTKNVYTHLGLSIQAGTPETDSGMFLIHKSKLPHNFTSILVSLNCKDHTIYKLVYGDKELYRLTAMLFDIPFCTNGTMPRVIGKYFEKEKLMCGNAVVLETAEISTIAIHMTLHSVDHMFGFSNFLINSFWTHWITKPIDVDLRVVQPINQEIVP